jgi:type II secretory pathway pseudopilin PulG
MTRGVSPLTRNSLAGGASRLAALLLPRIRPVFSVVAPCHPGAALRDLLPIQPGRATNDRGYTLLEVVVATGIMLAMTGAVMTLLHDGLVRTPMLEEAADLHQRARVAAEALAADLRAAGSGTPSGPLSALFPAAEPRRPGDPAGSASADLLTIRYVPAHAARAHLLEPLTPASDAAILDPSGCPSQTTACGFTAGVNALLFDSSGQMDTLRVDAISAGTLVIAAPAAPRAATYPAGSEVAEAVEATYALDSASRQLRRTEGGGTFPLADNVEALTFEWLGDGLAPLALTQFQDGPFRAAGPRMFDVDLLRVRAIRATIRLTSSSARAPAVTARFTVALRNGG